MIYERIKIVNGESKNEEKNKILNGSEIGKKIYLVLIPAIVKKCRLSLQKVFTFLFLMNCIFAKSIGVKGN